MGTFLRKAAYFFVIEVAVNASLPRALKGDLRYPSESGELESNNSVAAGLKFV